MMFQLAEEMTAGRPDHRTEDDDRREHQQGIRAIHGHPRRVVVTAIMRRPDTCVQRIGDRLDVVDDARAPAGGDVVVHLDHAAVGDRRDGVPAGASGHGVGVLTAALGVGEEDQIGVDVDDVLGAELRVVVALLDAVGDVDQPEQAVHLPDEGVAGDAVEGGVELVVVRSAAVAASGSCGHRASMSACI